jgi:hypothetical protein
MEKINAILLVVFEITFVFASNIELITYILYNHFHAMINCMSRVGSLDIQSLSVRPGGNLKG